MTNSAPTLLPSKDQWLQLAVTKSLVTEAELLAAVVKAQSQRSDPAAVLIQAKKLTDEQAASLKAEAAGVVRQKRTRPGRRQSGSD